MCTYGVNQAFRFVKSIRLHQESRQNRKRPILHHTCATCSDLPSYISTMIQGDKSSYSALKAWPPVYYQNRSIKERRKQHSGIRVAKVFMTQ